MDGPLISLIVPCYNVEHLCDRFFDSLINQTYTNIQLIIVNDGSTDNTENKIFSFKKQLEEKGYFFDYVYQENQGLGGAINTGLKKIKGEYLCWADPDDYYELNAFECRVEYFINNPHCKVLTCDAYERKDKELKTYKLIGNNFPKKFEKKQFELLIEEKSVFCAGCHMINVETFKESNPNMEIYPERRGQNWQLLLPVYFNNDRYYLDLPIYNYIIYEQSMSHSNDSIELTLKRYDEHEKILEETIKQIGVNFNCDMKKYYFLIKNKYLKLKLITALKYYDYELFKKIYTEKRNSTKIDFQDRILKLRIKYKIVDIIYKRIRKN